MNRKHLPVSYDCTPLECAALRAIAESEYQPCAPTDPDIIGSPVWSGYDYLGGGILTSRNIAGALSSLAQKHLAVFDRGEDGTPTVALTEHGWVCYKAHFHADTVIPVSCMLALSDETVSKLIADMDRTVDAATARGETARAAACKATADALHAEQEHRAAVARKVASSEAVPL